MPQLFIGVLLFFSVCAIVAVSLIIVKPLAEDTFKYHVIYDIIILLLFAAFLVITGIT